MNDTEFVNLQDTLLKAKAAHPTEVWPERLIVRVEQVAASEETGGSMPLWAA